MDNPGRHVLIITNSDFPIPEGTGVRMENLAKVYAEHGHEVTFFAPNLEKKRPKIEPSGATRVLRVRIPVFGFMLRMRMLVRFYAMISQCLLSFYVYFKYLKGERLDFVQAEHIYSIPSALVFKAITGARIIVDDTIVVSDILRAGGHPVIAVLFTLMEKLLFRACDEFLYTSGVCRAYCEARGAKRGIYLPNGVDCDKLSPGGAANDRKVVFFNCSAYSAHNVQAIRNFLDIGRQTRAKVGVPFTFHLISGPKEILPPDLMEDFEREKDWFRYENSVPDIVPSIRAADVALLPYSPGHHITGGLRLKALEYMACGKPVIGTPEGVEGIEGLVSGEHAIIAASIEGVAYELEKFLEGDSLEGVAAEARRFVVENYDWRVLARPMIERLSEKP